MKIYRFEPRAKVVVTYGHNDVLDKPFEHIYDYIGEENDTCAVYVCDNCSMQDMRILQRVKDVRLATAEDLEKYYKGI